jgi:hypothetical protein
MDHVPLAVAKEAKAPVLGKERQSIPAIMVADSPFTQAGDPSLAHRFQQKRRLDPKTLCHDSHIDLNAALFELDHRHCQHRLILVQFAMTPQPSGREGEL